MKLRITCLLIIAFGNGLLAQEFNTRANLDRVTKSDFFQIPITAELSSIARTDLSDIRILDPDKKQVPYIIRSSGNNLSNAPFIEFPILSLRTDSVKTILELEGRKYAGMADLYLVIANTAVERTVSLSGSDDRKKWFIIHDQIRLYQSGQGEEGSFVQVIRFPFIEYSYLKLEIRNEHTDPLNILKAGIFRDTVRNRFPVYLKNPDPSFIQKDSINGRSYIEIKNRSPYPVDMMSFELKGPKFYKRKARLLVPAERGKAMLELAAFSLSSDLPAQIHLNGEKHGPLLLEIDNLDNEALKIGSIHTEQVQKFLVAWLEEGKKYQIIAGNPNADRPRYDLNEFNSRIPEQLNTISFEALVAEQSTELKPLIQKSYVLWILIVAGVLLLAFLSYRLMEDMKRLRNEK